MNQLTDKEAFTEILHAASETVSRFEQNELSRFYQKLRDRIRQADKNHLLFLEHNYFCNMGIKSSFHIPADTNGKPDSLCVYATHFPSLSAGSQRTTPVLQFHRRTDMPVEGGQDIFSSHSDIPA